MTLEGRTRSHSSLHGERRVPWLLPGGASSGARQPVVDSPPPPAVRRRDAIGRRMLLAADLLAALLATGLVRIVFGASGPGSAGLLLLPVVPLVYMAMGLYRRDELLLSTHTLDEAPAVFQAATLSAVGAYLLESAVTPTPLGAQVIAVSLIGLTGSTVVLRVVARSLTRHTTPRERCLVVGSAEVAERFAGKLASGPAVHADLVGRLDLQRDRISPALAERVTEARVHRVVVAGEGAAPERVHDAIQSAKALGVKVSVLPRMFEVVGSSVAFDYVDGMTVLGVRRFGLDRRQRVVKRSFDLAGSLLLLALLSPVMALFALAVRCTSPGPVLFRQTRVGRGGGHFQVFKFRSMVADAENRKAELRSFNQADGLFKIADDPRITRVGRLLRRTSLDELPQLFNVVRGEMSLVGPRPLVIDEDVRIEGFYRRRLHLTPGMTGPWQVLGSARIPLREMMSIDYLYVANWSLWGDVKILLRTVPVVMFRRGQ
jgi:exopolysaccharide biosynthesis polyprenyl glycosylphosphotransferase